MRRKTTLHQFSLLYLLLPVIVFWWGWFRIEIAIIATILSIWVYIQVKDSLIPFHSISSLTWVLLLLLSFGWVFGSGIGEFRPQHFDYFKHNLLLNNLVRYDWAVVYPDGSYLCYYVAYYLPAALLSKIIGGVAGVKYWLFLWSWAGLVLVFAQLYQIGGWKLLLIFLFFNSPEAVLLIYEAIKSPHTIGYTLTDLWTNDHTIELLQTPGGLMIPSHVESFTAAPQHSLVAWLAGIVFTRYIANSQEVTIREALLTMALSVYWSPLVAVGFIPLVGYTFVKDFTYYDITKVIICLLLIVPALIYYAGHIQMQDKHGWWWQFVSNKHQLALLLTFLLIEVGFWAVLLLLLRQSSAFSIFQKRWLMVSIGSLLLISLYRYGYFNDLTRRACLPLLLVICWGFATYWHTLRLRWLQVGLLILIGILPLKHYLRWFTPQPYTAIVDKKIADFTPHSIHELGQYHAGEFDVVAQYLGERNSWYKQMMNKCSNFKTTTE